MDGLIEPLEPVPTQPLISNVIISTLQKASVINELWKNGDGDTDDVFAPEEPSNIFKTKIQGITNAINTKTALEKGPFIDFLKP